jgi:hypothetical protein
LGSEDEPGPATPPVDGTGAVQPDAVLPRRRPRDDRRVSPPSPAYSDVVDRGGPPPPIRRVPIPINRDTRGPTELADGDATAVVVPRTDDGTARDETPASVAGRRLPARVARRELPARVADESADRRAGRTVLVPFAMAGASGALLAPRPWLVGVVVTVAVGCVARSLAEHPTNPAQIVARGSRRVVSWLRPRTLAWAVVHAARTAILALAIPATIAAAVWTDREGAEGVLVAARMGAWAHAPRTAAAIVCFMLLAGVGEAYTRRADQVGRLVARWRPGVVAAIALAAIVTTAGVATASARPDAERFDGLDRQGWLPVGVRDGVDGLRDHLVAAELHDAADCLSDRQGVTWRPTFTTDNPISDTDVARLSTTDQAPDEAALATATAAMHNQLAPWVDIIELVVDGNTVMAVDRSELAWGHPLIEPSAFVGRLGAGVEPAAAVDPLDGFDPDTALECAKWLLP